MENQLNSEGQKDGLWIYKDKYGKKKREVSYKNGILEGEEICYFNSYNRKESITHFVNGKRHGAYISFFNKARSPIDSKGEYLNDKMHGEWLFNDDDFYSCSRGTYVNGEKHGHWIESLLFGGSSKGVYINGKKEGYWINLGGPIDLPIRGPIKNVCYYKAGKLDGLDITFYGDGAKTDEIDHLRPI
jgi:antitoxin component YwqK of YwqJK toxin-antitoxin module